MSRRRRSDRFLLALGCLALLSAITVGDTVVRGGGEPGHSRPLVGRLGLTDLALATAARYTRHPAVADRHAPFQDHPAALDHFPAGAAIHPPRTSCGVEALLARPRYLLDYTLSALLRRKGRNLSLFAVYTTIVFALASVLLFGSALRREAAALLVDAPELTIQRLVAGRHDPIPGAYLKKVRGIRGVAAAEARLWGYYFDPASGANYTALVPTADAPEPGTGLIGAGVARARGLAVGDVISFRSATGEPFPLRVTGLLDPASELLSADLIVVSERDFRRWMGIAAGLYTDLTLRVRNPLEVRTVAEKVTRALPDTRAVLREEVLRTYEAVFAWREGVGLLLLAGGGLAFAIFAWDRASGLSAEERREIGVLKAVGWDTGDILRMKLWEGAVVSLTAFLAGYVLAYAHVYWAGAPLLAPLLKGWATLYPDFRLIPHVAPLEVLALFALTVVPYTAVTLVPSWRAATADPDAVMRGAED